MAHFYAWETVDLPLKLSRTGALEDVKEVVVSLKQGKTQIEKSGAELGLDTENDTINMHLSQEDTSQFTPGTCYVQVNLYYANTERDTSTQASIEVRSNLHKELMP